jgi:hypothetical protein
MRPSIVESVEHAIPSTGVSIENTVPSRPVAMLSNPGLNVIAIIDISFHLLVIIRLYNYRFVRLNNFL